MKRIVFGFILLFVSLTFWGQQEESHWVFGFNGEVIFDNGIPQDAGFGDIYVTEGSASISNSSGTLLFFTDGTNVFDVNGNPMPNGDAVHGHDSSTQNVLIVPQPGDQDEQFYYIFGVPAQIDINGDFTNSGLQYVVVDMADNDGLGDVVQGPVELTSTSAEMLHATYHSNGKDVWVVVHEMNSSNWHSFLVSCDGVEEHQVSDSGRFFEQTEFGTTAIGSLKLSPNGNRIAATYTDINELGVQDSTYLLLGSFNNTSGAINIDQEVIKATENTHQGYGVCFSPNSEVIYWSILAGLPAIYQYDLNAETIANSEYIIASGFGGFGSMVIGPDAKIYTARLGGSQFLGRINQPDLIGANANYEDEAVLLSGWSSLGLPNLWMYPYADPGVDEYEETITICDADTAQLSPDANGDFLWNTGETSSSISVDQEGEYWVEVRDGCHLLSRWEYSVIVEVLPEIELIVSPEAVCAGDEFTCQVNSGNTSWIWSDGIEENPRTFTDVPIPIVISQGQCIWEILPEIDLMESPEFDFPESFSFCEEDDLAIELSAANNYEIEWSDGSSELIFRPATPGEYSLVVSNDCGELFKEFEVLTEPCRCEVFIPNAFTPDQDGTNENIVPIFSCNADQFQWTIFSRWGEEVFTSAERNSAWNGSHQNGTHYCEDGIYNYVLSVTWPNGETELIRGSVLLMR
ncbi:MAG: gliding motility-associated C-terminal domain-containing protein [Bacteroidota bacterium]